MGTKSDDVAAGVGCLFMVFLIVVFALVGGFCLQYSVGFWATVATGEKANIPYWPCAFASCVVGVPALPVAAITWVCDISNVFDNDTDKVAARKSANKPDKEYEPKP